MTSGNSFFFLFVFPLGIFVCVNKTADETGPSCAFMLATLIGPAPAVLFTASLLLLSFLADFMSWLRPSECLWLGSLHPQVSHIVKTSYVFIIKDRVLYGGKWLDVPCKVMVSLR